MRAAVRTFLAVAAVALTANAAAAQSPLKPFSFGVTGGASMPTGDFGDAASTGYNVGALLELKPIASPVSLRFEGTYQSFDAKAFDGTARIVAGLANAALRLPVGTLVHPYIIGGAGMYNVGGKAGGQSLESQNKIGINGGVGFELPLTGISTFVEARYHNVFTEGSSTTLFPVTVGLRF
jgi:hypothetical protein